MRSRNLIKCLCWFVVFSLLGSVGFSRHIVTYAQADPQCKAFVRNPFVKTESHVLLQVPVDGTIMEDDWIVVFLPEMYPIPAYTERRDETGMVTTTQDNVRRQIMVNFLPLDPFKPLPILNYAENSIAFPMPRALEVKGNTPSYLLIRISLKSFNEEAKGCFGIWHKSFSSIRYTKDIEITDHPDDLSNFSITIQNPVCNEVTDWDITFTHSYPWVVYKNQCTLELFFQKTLKTPMCCVNSRITVNGMPVYEAKVSDKYISIILPITIQPNDTVYIHIPASYQLGFSDEYGTFDYVAKVSISSVLSSNHKLVSKGSFDIAPGKPFTTSTSNVVGTQAQYSLYWYCDPEKPISSKLVDILWPSNYPIKENTDMYYKWGRYGRINKVLFQNGAVSVPLPTDLPANGKYELVFTEFHQDRSNQQFTNPPVETLQFAFRYSTEEDWVHFLPLVIDANALHIEYASLSSLIIEDSFNCECNVHSENLFEHLTEGFIVHFPSHYHLPTEIPYQSLALYGVGGDTVYPQVEVIQNTIHVIVLPEDLNQRYKDDKDMRLEIHPSSGVIHPDSVGSEIQIGIETKTTHSIDWTDRWVLLEPQKRSTVTLSQQVMGQNEWCIQAPWLHFETEEVGFMYLNGTFVPLPIEDIPLLNGQHTTYFYVGNEVESSYTNTSNNFLVKVDTEVIHCELLQPDKDWQIVPTSTCMIRGKVEIPITIDHSEFVSIIDQSIKVQDKVCVVMPDGEFQIEIPLQKGKNDIFIAITDWAGHTQILLRHVYHGRGVELQIGSKIGYINGREISLPTHPTIVRGRTFVPLRFLAEAFGAFVQYKGDAKPPRIQIQKDNDIIELAMGSKTATINGKEIMLEEAPFVQESSAMIPMYFLIDTWNMEAMWEAVERRITIGFPFQD
ncbi:MAG: copper amine oxidase N-terminal domain-containing protein [Caldisericia bacterium]|nr:copper amine oxidase N-terminal domain-containing protein [Caldisericia bacterium]